MQLPLSRIARSCVSIGARFCGAALWSRLAGLRRHRVPVVLQMSDVECGAACLAMILSYFGRRTRVSECREACDIGRDGVTAETLAKTARRHGLRVRAFSLEPCDLQRLTLPAVAHWNFDHFVVIERWSPSGVDIIDPAVGRRRLSPGEFDEAFTGVILTFETGAHFQPRAATARLSWRSYLRQMLSAPGTAGVLGQVFLACVCLQLLGLAVPLMTRF
jgi:ABC-type bacteriocin/lantibiotic exporter with double-glycine peptidase domain